MAVLYFRVIFLSFASCDTIINIFSPSEVLSYVGLRQSMYEGQKEGKRNRPPITDTLLMYIIIRFCLCKTLYDYFI